MTERASVKINLETSADGGTPVISGILLQAGSLSAAERGIRAA